MRDEDQTGPISHSPTSNSNESIHTSTVKDISTIPKPNHSHSEGQNESDSKSKHAEEQEEEVENVASHETDDMAGLGALLECNEWRSYAALVAATIRKLGSNPPFGLSIAVVPTITQLREKNQKIRATREYIELEDVRPRLKKQKA